MSEILRRRFLAFLVDYLIIALYAGILFAFTWLAFRLFNSSPTVPDPYVGQIIGFLTLTLPVFIYFFVSEKSKWKGTIGKRKLKIQVVHGSSRKIFTRNVIKFLPWEIAHTGVHWLIYYSAGNNTEMPAWTWIVLIAPQVIVVSYICSIIFSGGKSSIYDKMAKTEISMISPPFVTPGSS